MADPLSIAASAIAVLQISALCTKSLLSIIKSIRNAPEELMALSNEVNNLNAIIDEARKVSGSLAAVGSSTSQFIATFKRLLEEAEDVLVALNTLASKCKAKPRRFDRSVSWLCQKTRAQKYLTRLRDIREKILALLTAENVQHTIRISMRLEELHSVCQQLSQQVNSTPATIMKYLLPQPRCLEREDNSISETYVERNASVVSHSANSFTSDTQVPNYSFSKSVICFKMYKQSNCQGACDCSCHSNYRYRTPLMLGNLIGTIILGYTGSLLLRPKCDKSTCQNRTGQSFQFTYCFPQWFLERAIHIVAAITYTGTPMFGLEMRRRVGWGSEDSILRFALTGNTVGVKALLDVGSFSMTDVDPNHGRSALYYSVQYNRIETCEFLLRAGADPHAQDDYGISSYQKAWEQVFIKYGSPESLQALQRLFPKEAISETWEFSQLHRIILDILPTSLEATLQDQKYREQVNVCDYKGRTPLHWAATRGDISAVSVLLDNGADIDVQDEGKATPLILAASSGSVKTIELLLLAGANVRLTDIRGGNALHYVCRHQKNIAPVKLLLQAGAAVNCRNGYGHTPFIGAAIKNRHEIGMYLLQHGADMHKGSNNNNDTPLFESIFHNSHEFLRLLLREGAEHTHVNRSGSTILHATALEADLETIEILAASRPGGLFFDLLDKNGKTALEISRQRIASPDGFQEAFERFLMTVRESNRDV